jgi:CDP-4-dehydro-6-deoxyglucose reductase
MSLVTLSRTGKSFAVNPGEVILDAALRQEIWLPHACRGGTCGSCKAVIVAGDVVCDGGAPLRARQAALRREAYLCCAKPAGDITLDIGELPARPIGAMYRRPARVIALTKPTADVAVVTLKPPPNAAIRFRPGQYISVIGDDGRSHPFSIANAPRADDTLDLHIGRIPNGRFTTHVHQRMQVRDIVRFEGPFGEFGFCDDVQAAGRPAILIAGGTGIAPIKAMLEAAAQNGAQRELHVYWGCRGRDGLYALDELVANSRASVTPVLSEPASADAWTGRTGLVHRAVLEDFLDLSCCDVYACGSPGLIDAAFRDLTQHARLPADRFFADAFHNAATAPLAVNACLEKVETGFSIRTCANKNGQSASLNGMHSGAAG